MIGLYRWLLHRALPADARDGVVAELDEEFARRCHHGAARADAARWYRRQVFGSLLPAAAMRGRRLSRLADDARRDAHLALRVLARQKTFAATAALTLALGIGAVTVVYSVSDAVFFRPLPFRDGASLVRVWSANPHGIRRGDVSAPDFFDWRDQARTIALAAVADGDVTLTGSGEPARLPAAYATASLAQTLGLAPLAGRWFDPAETAGRGLPVVIVGERLWRTTFGAARDLVGRQLTVDGEARTVIGIASGRMGTSSDPDVWLPMPDAWRRGESRSSRFMSVVGRIQPGARRSDAAAELSAIANRLSEAYPASNTGWGVTLLPMREAMFGEVRRPLMLLAAAVTALLLVACANVAGLTLARGAARSHEFAVRSAIGASRSRLLRQQLVETSLIALVGGGGGLLAAAWLLTILPAVSSPLAASFDRIPLDVRVLGISAAITLLSALVSGLTPAWYATRQPGRAVLSGGARHTGTHVRVRRLIVVAQIGVATALVACGLLLQRSLARLIAVPAGFAADRTLVVDLTLPRSRYSPPQRTAFFEQALERVRALPGVETAGAGGPLPLSGSEGLLRFGVTHDRWRDGDTPERAYVRWATSGYFTAMGIAVRGGRPIDATDTASSPPAIVVDEQLGRALFGDADPIGRRLQLSMERDVWRQVVGVVAAVHQTSLDRGVDPHVYVPQAQMPSPALSIVVRGSRDPRETLGAVRDIVHGLDASLPLGAANSLEGLRQESVAPRRLNTDLLSLFAAAALMLTTVGVYGVMAQIVVESARELGIRLALGAPASAIVALTFRRALSIAIAGVAVGLALTAVLAPALRGLLYAVGPHDPVALAASIAVLLVTAMGAAYIPVRRLRRLDVVNVLRDA